MHLLEMEIKMVGLVNLQNKLERNYPLLEVVPFLSSNCEEWKSFAKIIGIFASLRSMNVFTFLFYSILL